MEPDPYADLKQRAELNRDEQSIIKSLLVETMETALTGISIAAREEAEAAAAAAAALKAAEEAAAKAAAEAAAAEAAKKAANLAKARAEAAERAAIQDDIISESRSISEFDTCCYAPQAIARGISPDLGIPCRFCMADGVPPEVCKTHSAKNIHGKVTCPRRVMYVSFEREANVLLSEAMTTAFAGLEEAIKEEDAMMARMKAAEALAKAKAKDPTAGPSGKPDTP